jgi:hypothetical protein
LPSGIGLEGAGVVEAVGTGVTEVKVGDRVAYAGGPLGAYADIRNLPAHRLLVLPEAISFETGAAMMLQGLTAAYLLRKTYRVQPGDAVLIQAAAGGVGLIACQWAKALGRDGDRHGGLAGQGRTGLGAWLPSRDQLRHREFHRSVSATLQAAKAWRWSMTASARTPLPVRWTACGRWA